MVGKQITVEQLIKKRIVVKISKAMIMYIGITSKISRPTLACIYYYYSTHRPLLIRPFASCFYINIYCIMGCYYTLCHNTYAYSLLFYKVYMKRENAGSWNSGLEKEQILETYFAQLRSPETLWSMFLEYKKILGE